MNLRACARCGTILRRDNFAPVCPDCYESDKADYARVRAYLERHPRASLMELVQATGLPLEIVRGFLNHGRLNLNSGKYTPPGDSEVK